MANTYTAATLTPYDYSAAQQKIADEYSAKLAAEQQALKDTYDQNALTQQAANAKIPGTYQTQANQAAAKSEQNRAAFNTYAAGTGINSGVGSQANLAQNNALQNNLTTIRTNEANAVSAGDLALTKIKTDYQNGIAEALANNDYQKASALMDAWNTAETSRINTEQNQAAENYQAQQYNQQQAQSYAQTLAQYGDFSGYKALGYTDPQIAAMQAYWNAKNGISSGGSSGSRGRSTGVTGGDEEVPTTYSSGFSQKTGNYRYGTDAGNLWDVGTYSGWVSNLGKNRSSGGIAAAVDDAVNEGKITSAQADAALSKYNISDSTFKQLRGYK